MALIGLKSLALPNNFSKFLSPSICRLAAQSAGITSAGGKPRERPVKPYNYRKKLFTMLQQPFDRTIKRVQNENCRVIIIDGPIASGKHAFAKKLAKELDFHYVPQSNPMDLHWVGTEGLHYQDLDELLPSQCRIYDLPTLLNDPKAKVSQGGGRAGALQIEYFISRLYTYNDALLHLLSIGQGVVCVRSPWTDSVFAKALYDTGYLSRNGYVYYKEEIAVNHLCDFPRPHLTIYLDAGVDQTLENIKTRNREHEAKSRLLSGDFIQSMESEYKDVLLPKLADHGELLVYPSIPDITEHEVALMVEDIEALGEMKHSGLADDSFLEDWSPKKDEEWAWRRRTYQNLTLVNYAFKHREPWDAPEMVQGDDWYETREEIYHSVPGYEYDTAHDPNLTPWWRIALGLRMKGATEQTERRRFWVPAPQ